MERNLDIQTAVPCSDPTYAKTATKNAQTAGLRNRRPYMFQVPADYTVREDKVQVEFLQ